MLDFNPRGALLADSGVTLLPFRNLHHLKHLELHGGTFFDLHAPMHLTFLSLRWSSADCSEDFQSAVSLLEMHLWHADIAHFHSSGVTACSHLCQLSRGYSLVSCGNPGEVMCTGKGRYFDVFAFSMPDSLSNLTGLTRLTILCGENLEFQLNWLTHLTALQSLSATFDDTSIQAPSTLSRMIRMSSLELLNVHVHPQKDTRVDCDLADFVALQSLTLSGNLRFKQKLQHLTALPSLKEIRLQDLDGCSGEAAARLGMLAHYIGIHRPDVCLVLKGRPWS